MRPAARQQVLGLVVVQTADAAFNAIPTQWLRDDLAHLGFPWRFRFVFPVIKSASAVGLLGGLRWPRLGRVTAAALIVYFLAAMGFHGRAKDGLVHYTPAAAMLVWSIAVLRAFRDVSATATIAAPADTLDALVSDVTRQIASKSSPSAARPMSRLASTSSTRSPFPGWSWRVR